MSVPDILDATGNTTPPPEKASRCLRGLTACALHRGVRRSGPASRRIDISKGQGARHVVRGWNGPFLFSSMAISAVGKAAMDMVKEVRRQFKRSRHHGGQGKPEYEVRGHQPPPNGLHP